MKKVYAIHDRVANSLVAIQMYMLMVFNTDQQAARYFADAINDTTTILNKHPGDFELIYCGDVNDNGKITALEPVSIIVTGDALLAVQQPVIPS